MKKSLITASLLFIISSEFVKANNEVIQLKNDSIVYTTLTTKKGLIIQGKKGGLNIINQKGIKDFSFKSLKFNTNNTDTKIYALAEQSDGKIIIGGNFDYINGYRVNSIARINTDGSLDKTFMSKENGFDGEVYDIKVLSDNTILVGGYFTKLGNKDISKALVKLNSNGTINLTYDILNSYDEAIVNDIKVINNRIFLAGSFIKNMNENPIENPIISIDKFGNINDEFNEKVSNIQGQAFKIANHKNFLVLAGSFTVKDKDYLSNIIKMNTDGDINKNFYLENLKGCIFDVKYKNNTLLIGGDFILNIKNKFIKNFIQYKNKKVIPSVLNVNADIYDINTFNDKVILSGEGNFTLNGKNYQNNIMLKI